MPAETNLIYMDWVEQNRRRVDELSNGRIAYMHLPDMGEAGIREFIKWYYPQLRRTPSSSTTVPTAVATFHAW